MPGGWLSPNASSLNLGSVMYLRGRAIGPKEESRKRITHMSMRRRETVKLESPYDGPNFFFNPVSGQVHTKVSDVVDFGPVSPVESLQAESAPLESLAPPLDNLDRSRSNRTVQGRMDEIMSEGIHKMAARKRSVAAPAMMQANVASSASVNALASAAQTSHQTMNSLADSIKVCQQSIKMSLDAQNKLAKGIESLNLEKAQMQRVGAKDDFECWTEARDDDYERYRPSSAPVPRRPTGLSSRQSMLTRPSIGGGLSHVPGSRNDLSWLDGPEEPIVPRRTTARGMSRMSAPDLEEQDELFIPPAPKSARSRMSMTSRDDDDGQFIPRSRIPRPSSMFAPMSCRDGPYCQCPENNSPMKMKSFGSSAKSSMASTSCKDGPYCQCPENNGPLKMKSFGSAAAAAKSGVKTSCKDSPFCTCPRLSTSSARGAAAVGKQTSDCSKYCTCEKPLISKTKSASKKPIDDELW
jgi:hypothetical protein